MDKFKDRLFIRCFQCNNHVDKIELVENWRSNSIIFAAFCHGEVDICEINRQDLLDFRVVKGVVFQNKKIENVKGIEGGELVIHN